MQHTLDLTGLGATTVFPQEYADYFGEYYDETYNLTYAYQWLDRHYNDINASDHSDTFVVQNNLTPNDSGLHYLRMYDGGGNQYDYPIYISVAGITIERDSIVRATCGMNNGLIQRTRKALPQTQADL